jgi:hypothetical protein
MRCSATIWKRRDTMTNLFTNMFLAEKEEEEEEKRRKK